MQLFSMKSRLIKYNHWIIYRLILSFPTLDKLWWNSLCPTNWLSWLNAVLYWTALFQRIYICWAPDLVEHPCCLVFPTLYIGIHSRKPLRLILISFLWRLLSCQCRLLPSVITVQSYLCANVHLPILINSLIVSINFHAITFVQKLPSPIPNHMLYILEKIKFLALYLILKFLAVR